MINNELFRKAVEDSGLSIQKIAAMTGVLESKIADLMDEGDEISAVEMQALSRTLGMSENLRRNTFFNRDLPLD